jgi:hypothetical protein
LYHVPQKGVNSASAAFSGGTNAPDSSYTAARFRCSRFFDHPYYQPPNGCQSGFFQARNMLELPFSPVVAPALPPPTWNRRWARLMPSYPATQLYTDCRSRSIGGKLGVLPPRVGQLSVDESAESQSFVQLPHQTQPGVRGDSRPLGIQLQGSVERELKWLVLFLTG